MLTANQIPAALATLPNFVCYRLEPYSTGKVKKVPYNPHTGKRAKPNDSSTWGSLEQALQSAEMWHFNGIDFMFTAECGIIGIDLDHCLDEHGNPNETTAAILAKTPPTYIEKSPSGTGLHIFVKGRLSEGSGHRSNKHGVEIYSRV